MRLTSILLPITLGLAIAACGGSGSSGGSSTGGAPGPTGATGPTGAPQAGRGASGASGTPSRGAGAVTGRQPGRISLLEKSFFGTKSQVTYFVVKPGAGTPLDQAQHCVADSLGSAPSAYCFAFASQEAFRYSRISRRPPSRMGRPCWSAYWGKPKGRRPIGSDTNGAAAGLHCPGASAGTG